MLTNGFTGEEIASFAPCTTLRCTESLVTYQNTKVAFTAGKNYRIKAVFDPFMVVIDNCERDHVIDGPFFRKHFALDKSRNGVQLSETGLHAGRRSCGATRDDGSRSVHAIYAPLQTQQFRAMLCDACLTIWAFEAYEKADMMPDYIVEAHIKHEATLAHETADTPMPQLVLKTQ